MEKLNYRDAHNFIPLEIEKVETYATADHEFMSELDFSGGLRCYLLHPKYGSIGFQLGLEEGSYVMVEDDPRISQYVIDEINKKVTKGEMPG